MSRWSGDHTPLSERFWQKVEKGKLDQCWPWQGAVGSDGYGQIWDGTYTKKGNRRPVGAHKVSLIVHGVPQNGFRCALHRCNNKICVNPTHLYWGTNWQNTMDAIRDGLVIPVKVKRGEDTHNAILSEKDVVQIRSIFAAGGVSQRQLADRYGVTGGLISMIISRKRWSHVP